jgi:hypothetical protein
VCVLCRSGRATLPTVLQMQATLSDCVCVLAILARGVAGWYRRLPARRLLLMRPELRPRGSPLPCGYGRIALHSLR